MRPIAVGIGGVLAALALVVVLFVLFFPTPKWGEPGYRPTISQKCRDVWASISVDKDVYVKAICTPEEQHEIAGYRP